MKRLFLDTDVVLDVLAHREPHFEFSARILNDVALKKHYGAVSSLCFSNLYYIINRESGNKKATSALNKLYDLVEVLAVDSKIIRQALNSKFADFEDALQYHAALNNNAEFIITRNVKDYRLASLPVMTPKEFVKSEEAE